MTYKLKGKASNHYTTELQLKVVVASLECTLSLTLANALE